MRWYIVEPKRKIASEDFEGHSDHIEMSGEKVSAVISYAVNNGEPSCVRSFSFPMIRVQPNDTFGSYRPKFDAPPISFPEKERFVRVEYDGVLSIFSVSENLEITRRFFPSTTQQAFYEQVEITNNGSRAVSPEYAEKLRIDLKLVCEGYAVFECICDCPVQPVQPGEKCTLTFAYIAHFVNETAELELDPLKKRRDRVAELMSQVDLTVGDDVIDTMFAFAKIRAGESLFFTEKGLVHSPGGMSYYAATWCNDECEYVAPWFAFTGDEKEAEAALTGFRWYYPYMNDDFLPIPSSVIAGGRDYWCGAGDRGDASMYLYGLCRFLLTRGELPDDAQKKALAWCAEYILRQINADGVVVSDTDELENRISSGINLSTSSLSYGALGLYASLLKMLGEDPERYLSARSIIRNGIEKYYGGEIAGWRTYHYHKGCDVIRSWNCLPVYMGIFDRAKGTADSIDERLWQNGSCRSTEGEAILWDRSALYYIASLFRMGDADRGYAKLRELSLQRLLGDHVPYAVEAYPEGNKRHLSAESGLYCRIITDGLLNIELDENGATLRPILPEAIKTVRVKRIFMNGKYQDIDVCADCNAVKIADASFNA